MTVKQLALAGVVAVLVGLSLIAAPAAVAQVGAGVTPEAEARDVAYKARRQVVLRQYPRYYGSVDRSVVAGPALYAVLAGLYGSGRPIPQPAAAIEVLRRQILSDGRIDADERDMITELGNPKYGWVNMRANDPSVQSQPGVLLNGTYSMLSDENRLAILGMLDTGLAPVAWDEADKSRLLRRLAEASFQSRDHARQMKTVIAAEVARRAPASTPANAFQPFRAIVSETFGVINTFSEAQQTDLRHILADAVDDGLYAANTPLSKSLYDWIRPAAPTLAPAAAPNQ